MGDLFFSFELPWTHDLNWTHVRHKFNLGRESTESGLDPGLESNQNYYFRNLMHSVPKWSDTLYQVSEILQDFYFISKYFGTLCINSFMTEVPIMYKPVHWFAEQIKWMVSIY